VPVEQFGARRFEQLVMPHLDAAYNLARWLTRNDADAQDVVQEACLRAYKYLNGFEGQSPRAWLLKIVRNTFYTWLNAHRLGDRALSLEDNAEVVDGDSTAMHASAQGLGRSPETILTENREKLRLDRLVEGLPSAFREVLVLREMEEMSYRDIANVVGIPIGTVMSRLARARHYLLESWNKKARRDGDLGDGLYRHTEPLSLASRSRARPT
jgi:RNA polymerase sigma factor (sigma-70 family)